MRREPRYTDKLGMAVAKRAEEARGTRYHIVSSFNAPGWSVVPEGTVRAIRGFETKQAAISFATRASHNSVSQVVVHGKDGRIENIIAVKPR